MSSRDLAYDFWSLLFGETIIVSLPKPPATACLVQPELAGESMPF